MSAELGLDLSLKCKCERLVIQNIRTKTEMVFENSPSYCLNHSLTLFTFLII